jgi:hypothetical protein
MKLTSWMKEVMIMAAYPFQPLTNKRLKELSGIIKDFKHNVDTQQLRKEYNLPDRIIVRIISSASDQSSNHPKNDNS